MSEGKQKFDVCPECKVREGDSRKKTLYQCRYCKRWFCFKHFDPKLAVFKDHKRAIRDKRLRDIIEEDWKREDGHPDYAYSWERLNEYDVKKEMDRRIVEAMLNRSKAYGKRKLKKPMKEEELHFIKEESPYPPTLPSPKRKRTWKQMLHKTFRNVKTIGVFVICLVILGVFILSWTNFFAQIIMPQTVDTAQVETEIFELINEERANRGLPVLLKDEALKTIALEWSRYMAETSNLTHGDFEDRIARIGYSDYQCGEIIGMYGGWSPTLGREFVDMWLGSFGHYRIMMTPLSGYMDVGVSKGSQGFFAVVDFRFIES